MIFWIGYVISGALVLLVIHALSSITIATTAQDPTLVRLIVPLPTVVVFAIALIRTKRSEAYRHASLPLVRRYQETAVLIYTVGALLATMIGIVIVVSAATS